MLIADVMQPNVVTVTPETSVPEAMRMMRERRIRHLPVVEDGRLVGIISDRDVKLASPSPATSLESHELLYLLDRLQVREVMRSMVITLPPNATVVEAARIMIDEKIGAVAVTESGRLVGILTETDVLRLFVKGACAPAG